MAKRFKSARCVALLVLTALVPAGAARAATAGQSEIIDGVAAIVNEKVITYSEVRDYVQPVVQQLRRTYSGKELVDKVRAAQMDALNNLIDRELILQEFSQKGYTLPSTAVDEDLNRVIANEFSGNRTAFIKTLEAEHVTLARYRDQLRDRIIVQALSHHKSQQEVVVSPYKIEKYYQEHLDDYKVSDQIKLRMIFIKKGQEATASSPKPEAETNAAEQVSTTSTNEPAPPPPADPRRKLAEEIVAKLDAGESFESMAKVYSDAKEAKEGGDWGWVGHDVLRKELNGVAFSLKPGQHSRVIETDEGYYILEINDVKPAHTKPLTEARDQIEKILLEQQRAKMQKEWVKQLRAKAYIRLF